MSLRCDISRGSHFVSVRHSDVWSPSLCIPLARHDQVGVRRIPSFVDGEFVSCRVQIPAFPSVTSSSAAGSFSFSCAGHSQSPASAWPSDLSIPLCSFTHILTCCSQLSITGECFVKRMIWIRNVAHELNLIFFPLTHGQHLHLLYSKINLVFSSCSSIFLSKPEIFSPAHPTTWNLNCKRYCNLMWNHLMPLFLFQPVWILHTQSSQHLL